MCCFAMEAIVPPVTAEHPFVLLVTGAPGAGKSEAMTRVHDNLADDGIDSAAIDVDQLARSYPPIDQDRHLAHLRALSESFRQTGHRLLVVARLRRATTNSVPGWELPAPSVGTWCT